MSKYGHRTMNWFEAIVNKLGGEESADAFLRDELVVSKPTRVWKTWMIIKLGTGLKTCDDFHKALKVGRNNVGDWASDILGKSAFTVSETEQEVEIVNVSVGELGFKKSASYADICRRALEFGLDLCPAEVGPQLCLQWKNQTEGTCMIIAMNAIDGSDRHPYIFSVEYYGHDERYLNYSFGGASIVWNIGNRFVFLRRKAA